MEHYRQGTEKIITASALCLLAVFFLTTAALAEEGTPATDRKIIKALYIPLADHYAGIIAHVKYRNHMKYADFRIELMKSWRLLRAYFMSGEADMAFIISPQAMDMFSEKPDFRWVGLMHRDGNALAINDKLNETVNLPSKRIDRKPDRKVADAFLMAKRKFGRPVEIGVPHLMSTHAVILYKYLKDHGRSLGFRTGPEKDVLAVEVAPPKSPAFIKKKNSRGLPAAFEQSLPWADVVETGNFGRVAWYSKDVLPWPGGHVECIIISTDKSIRDKKKALREVIFYIHKAGQDIEAARREGLEAMVDIAGLIRRHIPEHNLEAIIQSLSLDLNVINYKNLNIDKAGLRQIMELALEAGILKTPIDIDRFADDSFATEVTKN